MIYINLLKKELGEVTSNLLFFIYSYSVKPKLVQKAFDKINIGEMPTFGQFMEDYFHSLSHSELGEYIYTSSASFSKRNQIDAYKLAAYHKSDILIKFLFEFTTFYDRSNQSYLDAAIYINNPKILDYLLKQGGLTFVDWKYVLFTAAKYCRADILHDYKENFTDEILKLKDAKGNLIFNYILHGAVDLIKTIVNCKNKSISKDLNKLISRVEGAVKCLKLLFDNKDIDLEFFNESIIIKDIKRLNKYHHIESKLVDKLQNTVVDILLEQDFLPREFRNQLIELTGLGDSLSQSTAKSHISMASGLYSDTQSECESIGDLDLVGSEQDFSSP